VPGAVLAQLVAATPGAGNAAILPHTGAAQREDIVSRLPAVHVHRPHYKPFKDTIVDTGPIDVYGPAQLGSPDIVSWGLDVGWTPPWNIPSVAGIEPCFQEGGATVSPNGTPC
jgi:hypothetical protein